MRAYARKSGEDEELWGVTGLLHDFDYERWPNDQHKADDEHPSTGVRLLRERGYPEEMCEAILGHADYTGVPRTTQMARTLAAVDELTGFITACALVRPNGVTDMKLKSVKKKLKDPSFARAVDRDELRAAVKELGVDFDEHVRFVIDAMREIAADLDLEGSAAS
jgi:putative nucleotidyltransferase with HDIG domain